MTSLILLKDFLETQIEIWRPIAGLPGYDISSLGRLRSWRMRVLPPHARYGSISGRRTEPLIRKLNPQPRTGRLTANICIDGKIRTVRIAQLVAQAFIPNPDNKPEVNHKSGVRNDNRVSNVEWVTKKANQDHATQFGLVTHGERHGIAKLTNSDVREIRRLGSIGLSQRKIAKMFGVSQFPVSAILSGKAWKRLE